MATFFVRYDPADAHLPTSKQRIVGYQAKVRRKGYPPASKTFPTLRDAKDWAKMIEADMIRSVFVDHSTADRTTLGEALEVVPPRTLVQGLCDSSNLLSLLGELPRGQVPEGRMGTFYVVLAPPFLDAGGFLRPFGIIDHKWPQRVARKFRMQLAPL